MGVKNICCEGYPRRQPSNNYLLLGPYVKEGHAIKTLFAFDLKLHPLLWGVMCLEQQGFSLWIMGKG